SVSMRPLLLSNGQSGPPPRASYPCPATSTFDRSPGVIADHSTFVPSSGDNGYVLRVSGQRLVGRDGELRRLLDLLDDTAGGRPAHGPARGAAGGATPRLVPELAGRAAGRGFTVLSGRCAGLADSIPSLPLADALRAATTGPSPDQTLLDAIAARPVLGRL